MKLDEVAKKNLKLFVDMDGVLADFVKGISKELPDYDDNKYAADEKYRDDMWDFVEKFSEDGGKLWLNLPEMKDAKVLWDFIKDLNPEILSATGKSGYGAADQKRQWIKEKYGDIKVNLVRKSKEKAKHATPDSILIDDRPKSIDPWKQAGGIGILHTSAKDTITQLKKLGF